MEIKGSAVRSILDYVKKNHSENFQEWLNSLPESSRIIIDQPILPANWYPVNDAAIIPTEKIGAMFFQNDYIKGAWQSGRFSAEAALTGIYKFFVQAASPHFIIGRASRILSTYYNPSEISVVDKGDKWVKLYITQLGSKSAVIESRIGGWIERAMEISGAKNVEVKILQSMSKGDPKTEIMVSWQ